MCGIIGVIGDHEVAPILVEALKRLEYRGYDSAGIATLREGALDRRRSEGKLANLSDLLVHEPLPGKIGIGHTRWATHGPPTMENAHPHMAGPVAVVHNGIIENHLELRGELRDAGIECATDTDTETIAQLAALHMRDGADPAEAAFRAVDRIRGASALAFMFEGEDDLIVAAMNGSPLAIGHGDGGTFVGSDAIALATLTERISYLEEGDRAILTRAGARISDRTRAEAARPSRRINLDSGHLDKAGHKHFMAKEIAEQPAAINAAIRRYVPANGDQDDQDDQNARSRQEIASAFEGIDRVSISACGTAHYAGLVAGRWFEDIAGLPVEVEIASEFRYRDSPSRTGAGTLAIFVSQSGETADTLADLRHVRETSPDTRIVSIVNVEESSIARESHLALPILAGPEIGVASTKAFTCQLATLFALALGAAQARSRMEQPRLSEWHSELLRLPALISAALDRTDAFRRVAQGIAESRSALFLGRGAMHPLALEGALKLKEISYIHAEGHAAGELKHGPIALIDETMPVIVFAPSDNMRDKTMSNVQEVLARKGRVILVSDEDGIASAGDMSRFQDYVAMPQVVPALAPIVYAIPAQLLAYHTAVAKGTDVDQPRNLAKSVTVE